MKALVVYGSRWGGTVDVAQTIAKALTQEGFSVDVVDAKKSPQSIEGYDFIIVGSGLRADRWTKEALCFLETNAPALRTKKTALFVSCSMADRKDAGYETGKKRYLDAIATQYALTPISMGYFGGLMDFSYSHGLLVDIIVRINRRNLRKNGLDTAKVHDTRDWAAIEAWGRETAKLALQ
ncbi:MAG: flavodoxin domain-containing protein [Candidatus Bathyarchaeota archaeon]|nr:flavodoxin domain-containing protein [Candidatus Bathyarchaeota archaeon]